MKILALGDSFTFGDELEKIEFAWPYLLANKCNASVVNLAISGGSNTQIVRKIVKHADQFDLVVIGWSIPTRIEINTKKFNKPFQVAPSNPDINGWSYEMKLFQKLIPELFNEEYLYQQFLINLLLVQGYLKSKNIKYLMSSIYGYNNDYYYRHYGHISNNIDLLHKVDPTYFIGWSTNPTEYQGMNNWAKDTPYGPNKHFLELGHQKIAEKYYEHIRNFGWLP